MTWACGGSRREGSGGRRLAALLPPAAVPRPTAAGLPLAALLPVGLLLGAAAAPAAAQAPGPATRAVEARRALAPSGLLRIWNLSGSVRVVAWDRDSVVVTGRVPVDEKFFCGGRREAMKCGVDVPPGSEEAAGRSTLEVRVPVRAQLWLKSGDGDVVVSGFAGDLDAYSVSGRIDVSGAARVLTLESMGGDIVVAGSATTVRARTAGGRITLGARIDDATATSVSGDVVVRGGAIRRGRLESIDGAVRWRGPLAEGADVEITNHGGSVELFLPPDASGAFEVHTYVGTVQSDFGPAKLLGARDQNGRELSFVLGRPAGARVTVRTFKGPVAIRRL
ncbi:MAG TPA: DUF4097 family beta strand repeat-containing protein [Longimicrobiales bacterium]|nr:DUF4097 family beta strand repeat-containing protein [Longimicrobiales bacterium]